LLQVGKGEKAAAVLREILAAHPGDQRAAKLLQQIKADPTETLGAEHFAYKVQAGESLSVLAKRYLGDPLQFYLLARYNHIQNPSHLDVGQTINIPTRSAKKQQPTKRSQPAQEGEATPTPPVKSVAESVAPTAGVAPQPTAPTSPAVEATVATVTPDTEAKRSEAERLYTGAQYEEAIALLEGLRENEDLDPKGEDLLIACYAAYADALVASGELEKAKSMMEHAVSLEAEGTPQAEELETRLVQISDRLEAKRLFEKGKKEVAAGELESAYDSFTQVLVYDPDHEAARHEIDTIKPQLAEQLHKKAMLLYRQQDLDGAIAIWDRVLELNPNHELAIIYRARAVELKHRLERL